MRRNFFILDNKNPKYQKILFLHTDKIPVLRNIHFHNEHQEHIFQTVQCHKTNILIQRKGFLKHRHPREYPTEIFFGRNFEYAFREKNVTNAIDMKTESKKCHSVFKTIKSP